MSVAVRELAATREPNSAADRRPGNRPYYISPNCPVCGTALVLSDVLENPKGPKDEIWHDEWECSKCRDGVYMDWPEDYKKKVEEKDRKTLTGEMVSDEELRRRLGF